MDFDLPDFDTRTGANRGFELQLIDPKTNAPTQRFIMVCGVDSDAYEAAQLEQRRRWIKTRANRRNVNPSPEELDHESMLILAACTKGWRGFKDRAGAEVPFSREAAVELYRKYDSIREQVDAAIADRANFLQDSGTS